MRHFIKNLFNNHNNQVMIWEKYNDELFMLILLIDQKKKEKANISHVSLNIATICIS